MNYKIDNHDKIQSRKIAISILALITILIISLIFMIPLLNEIIDTYLTPGLNLKESAIISFFVTILLMIVFATSSGDGLIGELQFILGTFFLFFIIIWLMLAWIF